MVKVKMDDPSAEKYPFIFRRGDLVVERVSVSIDTDTKGEIVDGEYEGSDHWYSVIYVIKRLKDGFYYKAKELDLEKVDSC